MSPCVMYVGLMRYFNPFVVVLGDSKKRELPEVNGKGQSYRKFWIVPQETSSDCSRPSFWGSPASGCWGAGEIRFEQSPSGMWLSSRKKAISFQVPSAARPPVAGKGWAEEVAWKPPTRLSTGPFALLLSMAAACVQFLPWLPSALALHSRLPPCQQALPAHLSQPTWPTSSLRAAALYLVSLPSS